MPQTIHQILQQVYGYPAFRPGQQAIIEAVINGQDTLALLPTGGGKSICYQVPALAMEGICIVVTPLIALMKDQVQQLRRRNINALALHSGMTFFEVKKTLENACQGVVKFLYVSPERLQTHLFQEYLPGMQVCLLAVDEAHCISQWGYDFRPPYLRIAEVREIIPYATVLALTASATPQVQQDIIEKLRFGLEYKVFSQSFARPNLSFSAFELPYKAQKLIDILQKVPGTALVYCRNRRRTKEVAQFLQTKGINASFYHAGLTTEERSKRQDDWLHNRVRVMVCTNAFGMGIDKPDVRCVVHIDVPDSLEAYYQEAGRAGRDGLKAFAVLLYSPTDLQGLQGLPALKFPPLEDIRKVYDAIASYLQIPAGAGDQQYFDFDLGIFCERFKMEPSQVLVALQNLAMAGYLSFAEQVFLPSRVGFVAGRSYLEELEANRPDLEPLIKALLRTYEGILDNEVSISERQLAGLLKTNEEAVVKGLQELVARLAIEYRPKKDPPQLFYMYPRLPASQLHFNEALYQSRRQTYRGQIAAVTSYAQMQQGCRSQQIRRYFNDEQAEPCGICDLCLASKKKLPSPEQLALAAADILTRVTHAISPLQLRGQCLHLEALLYEEALKRLLAEEKLRMQQDGHLVKAGA